MKKNILVIEDDPAMLDSIGKLLAFKQIEYIGIAGTNNILKTLAESQPDLVLTDYALPGMNGGMICKTIKNTPSLAHIPVILMTAYHKEAIALGHFGNDGYLAKPFDNRKLLKMIDKLLN
ncbi:hypothetical protein GCM10023149_10360 [Mucilaginibacter gynuensis]|uniref:Response regulatory domain-containing protein n=1 Tax=Mucilaginibacter gynuensis TaxID=1302236 RepID=A0ABP8FZL3_9SPHI